MKIWLVGSYTDTLLNGTDTKNRIYHETRLRWFLSIALRTPTAIDFCVISARKLARAGTQQKKFPASLAR